MGYMILVVLSIVTTMVIVVGLQKASGKEMKEGFMFLLFFILLVGYMYLFAKIENSHWLFDTTNSDDECQQTGPFATDC